MTTVIYFIFSGGRVVSHPGEIIISSGDGKPFGAKGIINTSGEDRRK